MKGKRKGNGVEKREGGKWEGKRRWERWMKEVVPSSVRMWLRLCYNAKNWWCLDIVDTNGLTPLLHSYILV